ncbi:conserved hypothetical protein [Neospora caninum Liverpool]|uniref:Uncharacterized protein n=1 Tax=Neospora caninum (strain Liverpool) TaxID=572307 RepID=F0VEA3_NEOCL|nr:conserved hypothetical protein [Neospora caninum Liverpool]CBZ52047.1 conserved hypothetical protein [Neospora caninum Liverpool]CEL66008.1 TPA: hypothetical protein BN1204_018370 [Neospora caninum Liverpool]|eukprot:XP_003882079.1 conserved hypothetical protein [Neospora caninum Liverpool]
MNADESGITSGLALGSCEVFDFGHGVPASWFTNNEDKIMVTSVKSRTAIETTPVSVEQNSFPSVENTPKEGSPAERAAISETEQGSDTSGRGAAHRQETHQAEDERFLDLLQQLNEKNAFNYGGEKSGNCCCRACLLTDARREELLTVRRKDWLCC